MFRKISIIGHPIGLLDLFFAVFNRKAKRSLCKKIKNIFRARHVFLTNSGMASFYIILSVLKKLHRGREVILPSYTASSLIVAVRRAGLKPVLCDISLDDFNADLSDLAGRINKDTLCVVSVHMFGIPWSGIKGLNKKRGRQNIFVVEDCAQAFGAKIDGSPVGLFGDIGFFSFNRGKNLPAYEGGCIVTQSDELASLIEAEVELYPPQSLASRFTLVFKLFGISLAFRPFFYRLLHPLIDRFRDNAVPGEFEVHRYVTYLSAVCLSLLEKVKKPFNIRQRNGRMLMEALSGVEGVRVPKISADITPMFNRFPVIIEDKERIKRISKALDEAGIVSSRFYLRPLHHIFDLGYKADEFPNAAYFAEHLLTLPVHPLVRKADIEAIVRVIKNTL